eukprot:718311-Rhodomonas_salina.3
MARTETTCAAVPGLALSKDAKTVYVADEGNNTLWLLNLEDRTAEIVAGSGRFERADGIGLLVCVADPRP